MTFAFLRYDDWGECCGLVRSSDGMWEGHSALDAESSRVGYCEVFVLCFVGLYISIEYPYFCGN